MYKLKVDRFINLVSSHHEYMNTYCTVHSMHHGNVYSLKDMVLEKTLQINMIPE